MRRSLMLPMWAVLALSMSFLAFTSKTVASGFSETGDKMLANNNATKTKETVYSGMLTYPVNPIFNSSLCEMDLKFNFKVSGLEVDFTNLSTGEFTDVEWMFGDGKVSQSLDPSHQYSSAGIYYFTATLYNANNGCADFVSGSYYLDVETTTKEFTHHELLPDQVLNLKGKK